jgi:hypothetical protein
MRTVTVQGLAATKLDRYFAEVAGRPKRDHQRRMLAAVARLYVLATDRPRGKWAAAMALADPPSDPRCAWRPFFPMGHWFIREQLGRRKALGRIAEGSLGIEDRIGPWNGSFWAGLRMSGAIRKGPGTEWIIWEPAHRDLVADIEAMPLMHRLEPRASRSGQRRLRRCYATLLPPEDATGRSLIAGLFAGAVMRGDSGEQWLELPAGGDVQAILLDWGIPFLPRERQKGRSVVLVSPLFAMLVAHLMPPRSAGRIRTVRKAGGCPLLPAILWKMALSVKGRRRVPFPDAVPFGISRASQFRRGWNKLDLHRMGWLDYGIRVPPKLRELLVDWLRRRECERHSRPYDPETYPLSPDPYAGFDPFEPVAAGIPAPSVPPRPPW